MNLTGTEEVKGRWFCVAVLHDLFLQSQSVGLRMQSGKGPLQKLVHEVMHDHHDPAHLVGMGCCLESRRALYKFVNSKWFEYVTGKGMIFVWGVVFVSEMGQDSFEPSALHDHHVLVRYDHHGEHDYDRSGNRSIFVR